MSGADRWLPYGVGRKPGLRLFCLPHAGGGASSFRSWSGEFTDDIAVCPVQPPGRESRVLEQPYHEIQPLVSDLTDALGDLVDEPYAVYGHSLGSLVGFELVREIRRRGGRPPVCLFVSGRHAPQLPDILPPLRDLPLEALADVLHTFGGTSDQVLSDLALMRLVAPLLRADFAVNETYRYEPEPPLDAPIIGFAASADIRASAEQVAAWGEQTSVGFRTYLLPGGHFAVLEHASFVCRRVSETLRILHA